MGMAIYDDIRRCTCKSLGERATWRDEYEQRIAALETRLATIEKGGLIPGEGDGSDIRSSNAVPVPLAVERSTSSSWAPTSARTSSAGAIGQPRRAKTQGRGA